MPTQTYYLINEETLEVTELGEFSSLIEAHKEVDPSKDHYAHNQPYIIVTLAGFTKLTNNLALF